MLLGRWARARGWIERRPAGRVLDVGCAFGFGTHELSRAGTATWTGGVEADLTYVRQAARAYVALPFCRADAGALPVRAGSVDTVVLLDVLEHLAAPERAAAEAARALRPGGRLLVSVPHAGPLAWLDSLNVYERLRRRWPWLAPLDSTESSGAGEHRHFTLDRLERTVGPSFRVTRWTATGMGLAEPLHVAILLLCRGLLRSEPLYGVLRFAYYTAYLVEDCLPLGRWGYHLMLEATRVPDT